MIKFPKKFRPAASTGLHNMNDGIPNVDRIGRFCWEILSMLKEIPNLFTYSVDFSLVNITHTATSHSIGYLDTPPVVVMDAPMYLTFALKTDSKAYPKDSSSLDQGGRPYRIWGTLKSKYLTLFIGRGIVNRYSMQTLLEQDLRLLYNLVGAITKNYATQRLSSFNVQYDLFADSHRCAQYVNGCANFSRMVDDLPIQLWCYTKTFWSSHSYLFDPRMIPNDFAMFWLMYLDPLVYRPNMDSRAAEFIKTSVTSVLVDGLTVLHGYARAKASPRKLSPSITMLFLYCLRAIGIETMGTNLSDTELGLRKYVTAFTQACADLPDFNQQFALYIGNGALSSTAQDLYECGDDIANTMLYLVNVANKQYGA